MSQPTDALIDSRVVARNIKAGVVDRKDFEKHLSDLEDCADLADETETQMVHLEKSEDGPDDA